MTSWEREWSGYVLHGFRVITDWLPAKVGKYSLPYWKAQSDSNYWGEENNGFLPIQIAFVQKWKEKTRLDLPITISVPINVTPFAQSE